MRHSDRMLRIDARRSNKPEYPRVFLRGAFGGHIGVAARLSYSSHPPRPLLWTATSVGMAAAESHVDRSIDEPEAFVTTNDARELCRSGGGAARLVAAAERPKKFGG
jgi:hypothetical protein